MKTNRLVEIDSVAVDEALAFAETVGPGSDFSAHLRFGHGEELLIGGEDGLLTVAVHHLLKAPLAEPGRSHLAAQIADDQLRRAAVGAKDRFDVLAGLIAGNVFDGR